MITGLSTRTRQRAGLLTHLALAAVCYLPLLFTARGRLAADTRQAVYLDPGRFLSDALSMWDPSRDLGTVTHQNIVLVWPMAVYYWLAHSLGIPLWFAQRVWTGSILFAAGAGVLYLARTIRWSRWSSSIASPGVGAVVAAFSYAMSPYVLQYVTRTSVLLLPWAALPWLIGFTARALETRGWRHPALFALVTLSVAVNATALALALVGPALWIVWSIWGTRESTLRNALGVVGRVALLGALTSLWWVVALLIEGRYGLPLLSFTETIDQVASTSAATEVLRGLGYWVPYLAFHDYPEVLGAHVYLENLPVMALQFGVLVFTFVGIVTTRWKQRMFFGALVVVGVVLGIGAYPTDDASPLSSVFHDFARSGGIGLALRSTTRAAPLALLGLACLLGAFVDALVRRARRTGLTVGALAIVTVVLLAPSIAAGNLVDPYYSRPETLPDAWTKALAAADAHADGTRMLEIPGTRFAAYRWGTTYEPITTGNASTPTAWREQIPYGGVGSADLLVALDNRIQEGRLSPDALAPMARLLGVGQLLVRNDLDYERFETVAPDRVWDLVNPAPTGLGPAQGFGPVGVNTPDPAFLRDDSPTPADPTTTYPEVALVPVKDARQLVQVVPVDGTVVLDGNGDGIVDSADAGVLDGTAPVVYAATTRTDRSLMNKVLRAGGRIVLTDTNRRRVERWRTTSNTTGITLRADQDPAVDNGKDGGEAQLDLFPGASSAWQTVAVQTGARVTATRYGNPLLFEAGVRPAVALDGDPSTEWKVGPSIGGVGDSLSVQLDKPQRTDHLRILATDDLTALTAVDLHFDGGPPVRVALDGSSRVGNGQVITFPEREFSRLDIDLAETAPAYPGAEPKPVGIAELDLGGVTVNQVVRLPTALTSRLGASSITSPLSIVLTRQNGDQTRPKRGRDFVEEPVIAREFNLPTARTFSVTGSAVPNAVADAASDAASEACRGGILAIDGADVPVRIEAPATPGAGSAPAPNVIVACTPITLGRGTHTLTTTATGGVDVNQLVLGSDAGGTPSVLAADGRPVVPPTPEPVTTTWRNQSLTKVDVHAGRSDGPSWVLLAQSYSEGWNASAARGSDPAGPTLINGFANGWYVAAPKPHGAAYTLEWTPQRAMNIALIVSLVGVLVALGLVVLGRRWSAVGTLGDELHPDPPVLDAPWGDRPLVAGARVVGVAAVLGIASALVIGPWWGVAVAAVVAFAGRWRHGHAVLTVGVVGALVVSFVTVVIERLDRRHETAFNFFTSLHTPHRIALFALALFAGDLLLSRVRPAATPRDPVDDLRRLRRRVSASLDVRVGRDDEPVTTSETGETDQADEADKAGDDHRRARRRFLGAGALGALPAVGLFFWMVTAGTGKLFAWHPTADFYDVQAHRLLSGHLSMPSSVLGIEAFTSNGKSYMYQGPIPAILRFPLVAFTDAYDGRLAGLFMLLAFIVAAAAVATVTWQVRTLFRGHGPVGRGEMLAAGAFVFACTGASIPLFQASQVSVYHEGALWGMAFALWSFAAILRHVMRPARWTLGVAALMATLTLWSRASLGLGVMVALGLLFLGELGAWWWSRRGRRTPAIIDGFRPTRRPGVRLAVWALVACVVPVLLYTGLNVAKFGTPVSVPWRQQAFTDVSSSRREFLADNGDTFFGLQFVPTTLVEYLRPDAFELQDEFPWIGYRNESIGRVFGINGVRFEKIDATGSIPVSFPLLVILSAVGLVALVVARRRRPSTLRHLGAAHRRGGRRRHHLRVRLHRPALPR